MTLRLCLSFLAALALTGVLAARRDAPSSGLDGTGVIYVYYPSLCAAPADARNCREIEQPVRPAFESMDACSAHADIELNRERNPRLLANCLRQRES